MTENLYDFAADSYDISFNARPAAEKPLIVSHRLRKPTLAELIERESQIAYEMIEMNSREESIRIEADGASIKLWDKIILAVKGYRGLDDWHEMSEEEKAAMRPGHKATAIAALYAGECHVESDDDSISIGADTWTIRQEIGAGETPDWIVRHVLREPTEAERAKFQKNQSSKSYIRGAKKTQARVRYNLNAFVELYNALIQDVTGATANGASTLDHLRAAVDPLWKRQIILVHMNNLEAQISD